MRLRGVLIVVILELRNVLHNSWLQFIIQDHNIDDYVDVLRNTRHMHCNVLTTVDIIVLCILIGNITPTYLSIMKIYSY